MNALTFVVCKKPVIGIIMWLSSMCVTNQALQDTYINLDKAGDTLTQSINIPMDEKYTFRILLGHDDIVDMLKSTRDREENPICPNGKNSIFENLSINVNNTPSPLNLSIDLLSEKGVNIGHFELSPECPRSTSEDVHSVALGTIGIKKGKYKIQIVNQNAVALKEGHVQLLLMGQNDGFP